MLDQIRQGTNVQSMWATVRAAAAEAGNPLSGVSIQDMNYVWGALKGVSTAEDAIGLATSNEAITGAMVAVWPGTVLTQADTLSPEYMVRFQASFLTQEGEVVQQWMTSPFSGGLPTTVGDLISGLIDDANENVSTSSPPCDSQAATVGTIQVFQVGSGVAAPVAA